MPPPTATQAKAPRPALDRERPAETETALLALGCFWSPDAQLGALPGVAGTASGYAGGTKPNPTYRALGDHTETVEVIFDPDRLSYEALLDVFFESHDPTRRSWKRQYRSAVFALTEDQREAAEHAKRQRDRETSSTVRTDVEAVERPVQQFHLAEGYHQNHRLRQHPAFEEVYEALFPEPAGFARSTAASRVNGYAGGYGPAEQLEREIGKLGLPDDLRGELRRLHERGGRGSIWQRLFGA
jgi:methionine-S-sulfoxide reductase